MIQTVSADLHLVGQGDLSAQYTLVLDALNFCFWPEKGLEYEHMARGLKVASLAPMRSQIIAGKRQNHLHSLDQTVP